MRKTQVVENSAGTPVDTPGTASDVLDKLSEIRDALGNMSGGSPIDLDPVLSEILGNRQATADLKSSIDALASKQDRTNALLVEVRDQLKKGLLVKTVLSL